MSISILKNNNSPEEVEMLLSGAPKVYKMGEKIKATEIQLKSIHTEDEEMGEYRDMVIDDLTDALNGEYTDEAIIVMANALVKWNIQR